MKKALALLKKYLNYLKFVFVVAVLMIVVTEFIGIMRQFNEQQFKEILATTSKLKFIVILLIGEISILPMLGYDFILQKLLKNKITKYYLFETSWLINTMNNIIGFGGIFSIGLRSQFYGREKDPEEVLNGTSKIFLFTMSGLSIYSLLTVLAVAFNQVNSFLQQYWLWLLGGALYFPIVLIVTTLKKEGLLGGLSNKLRFSLLGFSFLEWSGVALTFVSAGRIIGIKVATVEILALFMAATVVGIISLIPGGLGSFDVTMLLGLHFLGLSKELTLVWLLLYRVAYYFVPFLIGLVFFIKHMGSRINKRFENIPKELSLEIVHNLLKIMLYFSGVMLILSATIPEAFKSLRWLSKISPWSENFAAQSPKIILGFLMVVIGRAISNRVKRAFIPSLFILLLTSIYIWFHGESWISNILLGIMIILIILTKSELYREQLVMSIEIIVRDGLAILGLIILYIVVGVYNLPMRPKIRRIPKFFLFPSETLWLSGLLAVAGVSLIMFILVRFLTGNRKQIGLFFSDEVEKRVTNVLETHGGNTESQLVYLGDKDVFFYTDDKGHDTAFLQSIQDMDKLIVMGNPSGNSADFQKLMVNFIEECDCLGYSPVFYEVSEEITLYLHEFGFNMIKMGEEGHVDLKNFTISGKKQRGLRATMNRLDKEGVSLEILTPPFSKKDFIKMREISDEWLGGRKEHGFSMGFFSENYLYKAPIAVVKNGAGELVAFANIMPTYTDKMVSIDLMRYGKDAPANIMDFLFVSLFCYYREQGVEYFNLGMAPLSNVGTSRKSFLQERIANLIYQFGAHFYSFHGLRDYKNKYANTWKSRYTMYSRDNMILSVVFSLLRVDRRDSCASTFKPS